jgi:hypothetical protein
MFSISMVIYYLHQNLQLISKMKLIFEGIVKSVSEL